MQQLLRHFPLSRALTETPSSRQKASFAAPLSSSSHGRSSRPIQVVAHFTGNYLDVAWTRQFVVGSLLQRFDPRRPAMGLSALNARAVEAALLESQRVFSALWKLPVRPLDTRSETRILRLLARYAAGEGLLSEAALHTLHDVLRRLPGAPQNVTDPAQMRRLLELLGYMDPGDNLYRVAYAGELQYPPQAHAFMQELLAEEHHRDGGDPFDRLRERRDGPAYAIDSATTSEVDDAIGVCVDSVTGERYFVVYVSDATVFCPFDSSLEQVTARRLTTTTYLPEGVFFMLPKPIVEAATLREDRPCRTFNVIFQIDEGTGEVKNYSLAVGWLHQLRRITYDQVQGLIDATEEQKTDERGGSGESRTSTPAPQQHPPPPWMTGKDQDNLFYILHCARIRLRQRLRRQREHQQDADGPPLDFSLPDPLIKVSGTHVLSVTDQIISTQDARLAVAELMIAANEVCSRMAQAHHVPIPFRGTRALSSDHVVAKHYIEPQGVGTLSSLDSSHVYLAEAMQSSVRRLSTVTRAIYHQVPLHHAGLDTTFYTHSTSPLRRYADMLVHHQLKTWLWQQHGSGRRERQSGESVTSSSSVLRGAPQQFIPEYAMASLCAMISTKQERASLLQDSSTRFWILRYLEDLERKAPIQGSKIEKGKRTYLCLVGETRRVVAAPAYSRFLCSSLDMSACLLPASAPSSTAKCFAPTVLLDTPRWRQDAPEFTYVSDIYLPEVQLAHSITHHRDDVRVGAVLECCIDRVQPTLGVLELSIRKVLPEGDERHYERLWMGGLVSQLDA